LGAANAARPAAVRAIDAFSPRLRKDTRAVVHDNWGCGAGNTVCSISVGGDVNPCSFLGPEFIADNVRHASFERIWHESERFRAIRGLPGDGTGTATFGGGCRARSLVMAGDVNAPDPWLVEHEQAPLQRRNPLTVLRTQRRIT
jgi:mycofactocin biosynthetic radical S-adenosylmethionine protein MftC